MAQEMSWPHVLMLAGSDSGGGTGIQADVKACASLGAYCSSNVTAITAQNSAGVQGVHLVPEEFIREQLKSVGGHVGGCGETFYSSLSYDADF